VSRTYFEEQAERMLAERGAKENPKPLASDLANWFERMYERGIYEGMRRIRDETQRTARYLTEFVQSVDKAAKEMGGRDE